jgi:hypothetical protein
MKKGRLIEGSFIEVAGNQSPVAGGELRNGKVAALPTLNRMAYRMFIEKDSPTLPEIKIQFS